MREILFRGKRLDNGKWVEGNLFIPDKVTRLDVPTEILVGTNVVRISYEVDPSTVGQYTGLCDKNGKKIFEGDILRFSPMSAYPVFWDADYCAFGSCYYSDFETLRNYDLNKVEVIGNVHDNRELLNED